MLQIVPLMLWSDRVWLARWFFKVSDIWESLRKCTQGPTLAEVAVCVSCQSYLHHGLKEVWVQCPEKTGRMRILCWCYNSIVSAQPQRQLLCSDPTPVQLRPLPALLSIAAKLDLGEFGWFYPILQFWKWKKKKRKERKPPIEHVWEVWKRIGN